MSVKSAMSFAASNASPPCCGPERARPRALRGDFHRTPREVLDPWGDHVAAPGDRRTPQDAFTLIELLVVIAVIGIVAAIAVPALKNFKRADAVAAATRQMQDALARGRQLAISHRTTVFMVFVPSDFWGNATNGFGYANQALYNALSSNFTTNDWFAITNLLEKQVTGYNFVSLRDVGDQPGQNHPKYLSEWRTLPEGMFIPAFKFYPPTYETVITDPASGARHGVWGFEVTNNIPFPTADTTPSANGYIWLPYVAFNHLGQLVSADGTMRDEEVIPLARGTVVPALDPRTKRPLVPFAPPAVTEKPAGNSTNAFTLIYVDGLTGRAHVVRRQIQ